MDGQGACADWKGGHCGAHYTHRKIGCQGGSGIGYPVAAQRLGATSWGKKNSAPLIPQQVRRGGRCYLAPLARSRRCHLWGTTGIASWPEATATVAQVEKKRKGHLVDVGAL